MTKINIRELSRNTKDISERAKAGEYFKVYKNNKFVFSIVPEEVETPEENKNLEKNSKYGSFIESLRLLQTKSTDANLSSKVDEIVYGYKD